MKKVLLLAILCVIFCSQLHAQSLAEKVSVETCACIGELSDLSQAEEKFKSCIGPSMAKVHGQSKDTTFVFTVENVQRLAMDAFQLLPSVCPAVKKLIETQEEAESPYTLSTSSRANDSYEKGHALMLEGDFEKSAKEFRRALKFDDKFVMALDNLAVCYRRMDQFDQAIDTYKKSLRILPNGEFALVNLGALYLLKKQFDLAGETYSLLVSAYPKNPEGHFGTAKGLLLREKFEEALRPICMAHRIYVETNSPHANESSRVISLIYQKMVETGKKEAFMTVMNEYNIEFDGR